MVQVLSANAITLRDLIDKFHLRYVEDASFFPEWQTDLPEISPEEQKILDKVKSAYLNLVTDPPVLEKPIQLVMVSPLLLLADFYLSPYQVKTEKVIEVIEENEGVVVTGALDILVLKEKLWLLVIESKRAALSIESGLAQLLSYLLGRPDSDRPGYSLVTNGENFLFIKFMSQDFPVYATSRYFAVRNPGNDLYEVLRILKKIRDC
ncbi:restriction endonuclease subunit R [Thermoleptolyngbya sp. C42_A2020_037]|uniref:restriction endonuclease subunit R n=1 Tax=Thermoleptolyngbya sp. C42_A2020_037 TaxID=2747799 RepID=UPI001A1065DC|nr:restriction endonuclease subunit R [Thermoleptolyngbya sp. C42_A2020_037]MBF2086581.1 restriction endonuclease subunit R [Thermoleptolyngbya sp. C42_A2020_037]